jgi:mono/diheme cytochrome c family protein
VDRRREPKPSLAQAARERCQRRPLLFNLAESRTVPCLERTMAVYVGKTGSGAVPQTSLAAAKDAALPADAPARRGEEVFVTQCIPCHRLNGGGASDIGPDLGQPMGATDYLTEAGLRALVRDPKSVRTWPQQQMPAFPLSVLPDTDLDALIAYLRQIVSQQRR